MKVRLFEDRDFPHLVEICATVYGGRDFLPAIARDLLQDPCVRFFAAEDAAGVLVGVSVTVFMDEARVAYLMGLRVHESARRSGTALLLLNWQLKDAAQRGALVARFARNANYEPTRRLAIRAGFEFVSFLPVLRWEGEAAKTQSELVKSRCGNVKLERIGSLLDLADELGSHVRFASELLFSAAWKPYPTSVSGLKSFTQENHITHVFAKRNEHGKLTAFSIGIKSKGSTFPLGCLFVYVSSGECASDSCELLGAHFPAEQEDIMVIFGSTDFHKEMPDLFEKVVSDLAGSFCSVVEKKLT